MDVKTRIILGLLIGLTALSGCNDRSAVSETPPESQTIADPVAWSKDHWRNYGFTGSLEQQRYDIDHDGVEELFIAATENRGNGGNNFHVFKMIGGDYIVLGEVFFHPKAFRVLPLSDEGAIQFVTYHRSSATEGTLAWWTYQNGEFQTTRTETIHPGDGGTDEGRRRYAELFGG